MIPLVCLSYALLGFAQESPPGLQEIVARLERLEKENAALREEVKELRALVGKTQAVEERLDIQERRVEEQAQTKVEASQRFPIRITGQVLFNSFYGSKLAANDLPIVAAVRRAGGGSGATMRQTALGLEYSGPTTIWGGHVKGAIYLDFYEAGNEDTTPQARVRNGSVEINWKSRKVLMGIEKPILAPRDPMSLSFLSLLPLTGAGNLYKWQPQMRFEQRFKFSESTSLRAIAGVYQTSDNLATTTADITPTLARRRPALQGRFELTQKFGEWRRVEIAPGFHTSQTHVAGTTVPSDVYSFDWFVNPLEKLEFSGQYYMGRNMAHFGAIRHGFTIYAGGRVIPVRAHGGWAQVSVPATDRLTFNVFGGQHDSDDADLLAGNIARNRSAAANLIYRLSPNVLLGVEAQQWRTLYLGVGKRLANRYDLSLAYQF